MNLSLNNIISTSIEVEIYNGLKVQNFAFKNSITYAGADLLVSSLIYNTPVNIKYLYCFFNSRGGDGLTYPGGDKKRTVRETFIQDAVSGAEGTQYGCFWVPINSTNTTSSGVYYQNNQILFNFVIPSSAVSDLENKIGNLTAEDSEIRAMGLASVQHNTDRTKDIIFSIIDIPEAENPNDRKQNESFVIPAVGQANINYPLTFTA